MEQTNMFLGEIQKNMTAIASTAGVLIGHLWVILTKQQVLLGLQQFAKGVFALGFAIGVGKWLDGIRKSRMATWDKRAVVIIFSTLALVLMFWGASTVVDSLPRLFNPEYYSIKEAVEMLQKVRK